VSRERTLARHLRTLETLDEAVSALRALSAQHFRVARRLLPAARAYREEITAALGVLPPGGTVVPDREPAATGIVLVAADLGLVGDYANRLVREAVALREEQGAGPLFCLGHRAASPLERHGLRPDRLHAAPASVESLSSVLLPLVDEILTLRRSGALGPVWLVAARFEGAGRFRAERIPVLPVVPPAQVAPIAASPYGDADHLRAVVVREYLVAVLYETLLEALASEHGKRLVTAESARSWLIERIGATHRRIGALRREASTQEVLEVVTAARAAQREREATWTRRG
jgi:F-type H+-transporting ATPase subunit gamma